MKYAYLIKTHNDYNEYGEEYQSSWYDSLTVCEKKIIRTLNSKKFVIDLINNGWNYCYVDVYLISDEIDNIYKFITEYKVLKTNYKIFFDGDKLDRKITLDDLF